MYVRFETLIQTKHILQLTLKPHFTILYSLTDVVLKSKNSFLNANFLRLLSFCFITSATKMHLVLKI